MSNMLVLLLVVLLSVVPGTPAEPLMLITVNTPNVTNDGWEVVNVSGSGYFLTESPGASLHAYGHVVNTNLLVAATLWTDDIHNCQNTLKFNLSSTSVTVRACDLPHEFSQIVSFEVKNITAQDLTVIATKGTWAVSYVAVHALPRRVYLPFILR